jgi:phage-related protein
MEKALEKESEQGLQVEQAVDEGQQEEVDQGNAATAEQIPAGDEASATPTLDAFAASQGVEEAPAPEVEGGLSAGGQDSSTPSGGGGGGPASIGSGGGGSAGGAPQPPTITAADASGEGTDSFDAFSDSTASQQAAWWSDLDSDLGESMAEEESAFQEGLPVFSAVMSGEDPSGAKATPLPTVAANLSGMDQGGGAVPDAAIAETQNLGSSDIEAGSLSGFSAEGGDNAAAIGAAMSAIPTTDGSVQTSPGPAPNVPLAGDADPARVGAQMSEGLTQAAAAQQEAMAAVAASPGPELVQPLAMNEEMSLSGITPATTMPDEGEVGGMLDFQELGLSSDVVGAFDELNSSEMQGHMDTAASEMDAASLQRDADRTTALGQADADAQSMVTDAHDQQTAMVADQRSAIDAKRQETVQAQAAAVAGVQTEASSRHASVTGDIESRVAADQARVASEFESADSKASSEVAKGEAKAEAEKKKAEKEAEEDGGGWFSAALDFVASAIDAVASAIGSIFDAVRSAVTAILDGVKALANSIIDAAVSFVTAAISAFGDFLKGAIQGLLGDVFPGLADALCSAVDAVVDYANEKVTALGESMKEGFAALCDGLAAGINAVLDVYEAAIQVALSVAKAIATGDWKEMLMMALQAALKLAGINEEEFFAMVGKGEDAIMSIIDDPGGFLSNCIDAVALGFGNFADNFLDHLQTGFIDWLTGSVGEAGIVMPPELNMAGILDITMQVLGLSYDMLREKAVEHLGEDNVALMEEVWGFIEAAISGGLSGLWEHVQGYLDGLWDAVIGGIQEFLMEKIIVAAVTKLASMFNPVAAIVQALMTAWDLYCWARDQMQRIYGVVTAFIDSMSDMATGNIDPAANKIEDSLAGLVPVAIDLLASILGLGGISDKVKGVIESVQQMVSDAIDSMIENVKGMFPGGGDKDSEEGSDSTDVEGGAEEGEEAPKLETINVPLSDASGQPHHLYFTGDSRPQLVMHSSEDTLKNHLAPEGDLATIENAVHPVIMKDESEINSLAESFATETEAAEKEKFHERITARVGDIKNRLLENFTDEQKIKIEFEAELAHELLNDASGFAGSVDEVSAGVLSYIDVAAIETGETTKKLIESMKLSHGKGWGEVIYGRICQDLDKFLMAGGDFEAEMRTVLGGGASSNLSKQFVAHNAFMDDIYDKHHEKGQQLAHEIMEILNSAAETDDSQGEYEAGASDMFRKGTEDVVYDLANIDALLTPTTRQEFASRGRNRATHMGSIYFIRHKDTTLADIESMGFSSEGAKQIMKNRGGIEEWDDIYGNEWKEKPLMEGVDVASKDKVEQFAKDYFEPGEEYKKVESPSSIKERGTGDSDPEPLNASYASKDDQGSAAHSRGVDLWTLDEENAFVQRARALEMPLAAGISGTTAVLLACARNFGLTGDKLREYTLGVTGHLGVAGAHSFHEIMSVAEFAGLGYTPGNYRGILSWSGTPQRAKDLFLKPQYANIPGIGKSINNG